MCHQQATGIQDGNQALKNLIEATLNRTILFDNRHHCQTQIKRLVSIIRSNMVRLGDAPYTSVNLTEHQAVMQQILIHKQQADDKKISKEETVRTMALEVSGLKQELKQVRELMAQSTKEQTRVVMSIIAQMQIAAAPSAAASRASPTAPPPIDPQQPPAAEAVAAVPTATTLPCPPPQAAHGPRAKSS